MTYVINFLNATVKRFLELILSSLAMSALVTIFNKTNLLNTKPMVLFALIAAWLVFVIFNVVRMRDCFFELDNVWIHYAANVVSYVGFGYLSLFLFKVSNVAYAWFFGIAKAMQYSPFGITTYESLVFFHIIGAFAVIIAPVGMRKMMKRLKEDIAEAQANIMPIPGVTDATEEQTEE